MPPAKKLGAQPFKPVAEVVSLNLEKPQFRALDRLSASLDEFSQNVAGITIRKHNEDAEEKEKAGELAAKKAIAEGRGTVDEMEEDKLISRGDNPFFREGVYRTLGKAKANAYGNALTVAYGEMVESETTDPDIVEDVISTVAADFGTDGDNAAMMEGWSDQAAKHVENLRTAHAGIVSNNMEGMGNELFTAGIVGNITEIDSFAPDQRVAGVLALVRATVNEHIATLGPNIKPHDYRTMNNNLVDAIVAMAGDPSSSFTGAEAIAVMNELTTNKGAKLFEIPRYKKQVNDAIKARAATIQTRRNNAQTNRLVAQSRAEDDTMADLSDAAYTREGLTAALQQVRAAEPGTYRQGFDQALINTQMFWESAAQRDIVDDRETVDELLGGFLPEQITTTRGMIEAAVEARNLSTATGLQMIAKLKEQQAIRKDNPRAMGVYKDAAAQLEANLGGHLPSASSEQAFLSARLALRKGVDTWLANNPGLDETSEEYEKWLLPFVERLQLKHIQTARGMQMKQSLIQRTFVSQQFREQDFGASEEELISMLAENQLLSDPRTGYEAGDSYYDFFIDRGGMGEDDVWSFNITRAALLGQLGVRGMEQDADFLDRLDERKDELLQEFSTRRRATGSVSPTDLMGVMFPPGWRQADSMGVTIPEAAAIYAERQDSIKKALSGSDDGSGDEDQ